MTSTTLLTDPRVFAGGFDGLVGMAVSPDGKLVAAAGGSKYIDGKVSTVGSDFAIRLWDVNRGKLIRKLTGHKGMFWSGSLCFSPDNKYLASANFDKTVRLWNVQTGLEVRRYSHDSYLHSLAFAPDGKTLLSGSHDSSLILWDVNKGAELRRFEGHRSAIFSVAISPDGRQIVSGGGFHLGGQDSSLRLWNIETGELVRTLSVDFKQINSVRFLPDGRRIVIVGHRKEGRGAQLWDLQTGHSLSNVVESAGMALICVAVSSDGSHLLVSNFGKEMQLWDLQSNKLIADYLHEDQIREIAFSQDNRLAFSASLDGNVRAWRLPESVWSKKKPSDKPVALTKTPEASEVRTDSGEEDTKSEGSSDKSQENEIGKKIDQ